MPTKFSHTPPDRANELFDKLLATSDNAVKTRERLFSELKEELELLASLQEQHLFPILQAHAMQDLLQQAASDNRETSALLEQLEQMPKNEGEFLAKVSELRRVFQQHIRDDRKELLPAILEVLSADEAQAVAEKVEDDVASFEEAKRSDARLPDAQADLLRPLPGAMQDMIRTGRERAQTVARGVQDLSGECLDMSQKRLRSNLDAWDKLAHCRSVQDLVAVQASLISDNMEQTLSNSWRIANLAIQLAEKAALTPASRTGDTAPRA
jgi:hypothetical protein